MDSESIDLIYLDPPFFSNRNYEVIWGDKGEIRSFEDRWAGGIENYISWLKIRVEKMYRLLKPTGSIFLHCDWHASHYIKVEILDRIFGYNNFRNEIIWKRTNTPKGSQFKNKKFGVANDTIFWYSKSLNCKFDDTRVGNPLSEENIMHKFPKSDEKGPYLEYPILRYQSKGPRPNLVYEYKGFTPPFYGWVVNKKKLEEIDKRGDLGWRSSGQPYRKFRPDDAKPESLNNIWDDILRIQTFSKEKIGYPTQKPVALIERIIKCACDEGDIVLDPFVGGGTTLIAAEKLSRNWIGIDQSVQAIKVSELRIEKQIGVIAQPYVVNLYKYDYDTLRNMQALEFEHFIIRQFGGISNTKQRGDFGLDGKKDEVPIQVKRSDNIGRNVIDNFVSAIMRDDKRRFENGVKDKKIVGYIIAFSFGKGAFEEVARLRNQSSILIELVRVDSIINISKKPSINIDTKIIQKNVKGVWEVEFCAKGGSSAGIAMYSWDFHYNENDKFKAEILRDQTGIQRHTFTAGIHLIAAKTYDNDGLEGIDVVRLILNGDATVEGK
jgi:DNA modification methylase